MVAAGFLLSTGLLTIILLPGTPMAARGWLAVAATVLGLVTLAIAEHRRRTNGRGTSRGAREWRNRG